MSLVRVLILVLGCCGLAQAVAAKSWPAAITDVETLAKSYWQLSQEMGAPSSAGSIMNELGVEEHSCTILSRLLDIRQHTEHLDKPVAPLSTETDPLALQETSIYLSNWVRNAKRLLSAPTEERVHEWNLNCVGKLGIDSSASILLPSNNAPFKVRGSTLTILADVEDGLFEKVARAVAENPKVETISLGSGGGSLLEGIQLGRMVRWLGLNTSLYDNCYSACTLVFLGGVKRLVWSPYRDLGFHQLTVNGEPVAPNSPAYQELAKYVSEMGVSPRFVLAAFFAAKPSEMYVPTLEVLCTNKFVTWAQRAC